MARPGGRAFCFMGGRNPPESGLLLRLLLRPLLRGDRRACRRARVRTRKWIRGSRVGCWLADRSGVSPSQGLHIRDGVVNKLPLVVVVLLLVNQDRLPWATGRKADDPRAAKGLTGCARAGARRASRTRATGRAGGAASAYCSCAAGVIGIPRCACSADARSR